MEAMSDQPVKANDQPHVPEERAGVRWRPKGGEFVVLSFVPDNYDGAIQEEDEPTITEAPVPSSTVTSISDALAQRMLMMGVGSAKEVGIHDASEYIAMLLKSREKRRRFIESVKAEFAAIRDESSTET